MAIKPLQILLWISGKEANLLALWWSPRAKRSFIGFGATFLHLSKWKTVSMEKGKWHRQAEDKGAGRGWVQGQSFYSAPGPSLCPSSHILLKGFLLWIALIPPAQLDKSSHSCLLGDKVFFLIMLLKTLPNGTTYSGDWNCLLGLASVFCFVLSLITHVPRRLVRLRRSCFGLLGKF